MINKAPSTYGAFVNSALCEMMAEQTSRQRRANIRLAILLALVAAAVLAGFIWTVISTGGTL